MTAIIFFDHYADLISDKEQQIQHNHREYHVSPRWVFLLLFFSVRCCVSGMHRRTFLKSPQKFIFFQWSERGNTTRQNWWIIIINSSLKILTILCVCIIHPKIYKRLTLSFHKNWQEHRQFSFLLKIKEKYQISRVCQFSFLLFVLLCWKTESVSFDGCHCCFFLLWKSKYSHQQKKVTKLTKKLKREQHSGGITFYWHLPLLPVVVDVVETLSFASW